MRTKTRLKAFDVVASVPGDRVYATLRAAFCRIVGQPPLTGIVLPRPTNRFVRETDFLIARWCLDRLLANQTCVSTNYGPIDIDTFFVGQTISGDEQVHLLAHLVLANLASLTNQPDVQDALFADGENIHLWFSAELPPDQFRLLVADLTVDLNALLDGKIQGSIEQAVFGHRPA